VALNLALFFWMGHVGLALATSASAWVNALLLLRGLVSGDAYRPGRPFLLSATRAAAASVIMVAAFAYLVPEPAAWMGAPDGERAVWLAGVVAGGGGIYLLCLIILGERPRNLLHRA
jgi:putative peptidoglycan lipid II flippase